METWTLFRRTHYRSFPAQCHRSRWNFGQWHVSMFSSICIQAALEHHSVSFEFERTEIKLYNKVLQCHRPPCLKLDITKEHFHWERSRSPQFGLPAFKIPHMSFWYKTLVEPSVRENNYIQWFYTDFRQKHLSVCSLTFHRLNNFTSCAELSLINVPCSNIQQKLKPTQQKGPDEPELQQRRGITKVDLRRAEHRSGGIEGPSVWTV